MIICVYLPLILGIAGAVLAVRAYLSTRAAGYLPLVAVFCILTAVAIAQWVQVHRSVPVEIQPGVWARPVLRGSLPVLLMQVLLIAGVLLLGRRRTKNTNSATTSGR